MGEETMAQLGAALEPAGRMPAVPVAYRRPGFVESLTAREATVLTMIVGGATNREAALALGISPRTVEFHRANIMQKSGARNLAELMLMMLGGGTRIGS